MPAFKPHQCPRCGYAYSRWMRSNLPFGERMKISFRHWGPLGHARAAEELYAIPWTCTCGAVLRRKAWRFGAIDVVGIVVLMALWVFGAARVPWMRSIYVPGITVGVWVLIRTASQFAIEEVKQTPPPIVG